MSFFTLCLFLSVLSFHAYFIYDFYAICTASFIDNSVHQFYFSDPYYPRISIPSKQLLLLHSNPNNLTTAVGFLFVATGTKNRDPAT